MKEISHNTNCIKEVAYPVQLFVMLSTIIRKEFGLDISNDTFEETEVSDIDETQNIAGEFGIDIHFVKPGVGETIRGFIRKKPDVILVKKESKYRELITEMALKNQVEVRDYPLIKYNACGIYLDKNSDVL